MAVKKSTKKRKVSTNKLLTIVLCAAIAGLSVTMISQQVTMSKLSKETGTLEAKINEQKEEKAKIDKQLEAPNELERVEQIARDQLGMLKPGERVFIDSSR
ncbi:MAG: septum formation initiator family protein [Clostridia bacterium]|nr:septum formation initiator family protein [Clostridia bacterium]